MGQGKSQKSTRLIIPQYMELEKEMLIHAARIGNIAVLEELIKGGANLNQQDPKGYTL